MMAKRKRPGDELEEAPELGATLEQLNDGALNGNATPAIDPDHGTAPTPNGAVKTQRMHEEMIAGEEGELEDMGAGPKHKERIAGEEGELEDTEADTKHKERIAGEEGELEDTEADTKHKNSHGESEGEEREERENRKRALHEKTKLESRKKPKRDSTYPAIRYSHNSRLQSHVKITDLQTLVLYILADGTAPQWVSVQNRPAIRQVVVLMVPGLELGMFNGKIPLHSATITPQSGAAANPKRMVTSPDEFYPYELKKGLIPDCLKPLADVFSHVWPTRAITEHRFRQHSRLHCPINTMLRSPLPKPRDGRGKGKKDHRRNWKNNDMRRPDIKPTKITEYLITLSQQEENNYVIHPAWFTDPESKHAAYERRKGQNQTVEYGWVETDVATLEDGKAPDSEIQQGSLTEGRDIYAVDCEMCKAHDGTSVLTRATLVNWDGEVILDELVKPDVPIKDYITDKSGITEKMLENVTTTLPDIQKRLLKILTPRSILLGHSLESDLAALKLTHPFLVDTTLLYPHVRGTQYKQSLKWLSDAMLKRTIQQGNKGHDSVEDARACLDLVKKKCEHGPTWGTPDDNLEPIFKRISRAIRPKASNTWRSSAVVDWGEPRRGAGVEAEVAIDCNDDEGVVQGIYEALEGRAVTRNGDPMLVDFVWGHLRELGLIRGFWWGGKKEDSEKGRRQVLDKLRSKLGCEVRNNVEVAEVTDAELELAVKSSVDSIVKLYEMLPRGTAFIVYSGSGDPLEMRRLLSQRSKFNEEYKTKPWDELSVQWTDTEVQALSAAVEKAREGISFVTVK